MLKRLRMIVKEKGGKGFWVEDLDCLESQLSSLVHAKNIIKNFNNTLRSREKAREVVRVREREIVGLLPDHIWQKQNLVTIMKGGRMYDEYRCMGCEVTGRRIGLRDIIVRNEKYKSDRYQFCKGSERRE